MRHSITIFQLNPRTFGTFFIQVDAPFETIRYCGFEWWITCNCVQCWLPKWFWMVHVHVGELIQNLVWIFPNGSTANKKPCLDTSKWWINGPSKTIWMDLNVVQLATNTVTLCVQNQWAFLKVEILNGFKWSISRRVKFKLEIAKHTCTCTCITFLCSANVCASGSARRSWFQALNYGSASLN